MIKYCIMIKLIFQARRPIRECKQISPGTISRLSGGQRFLWFPTFPDRTAYVPGLQVCPDRDAPGSGSGSARP